MEQIITFIGKKKSSDNKKGEIRKILKSLFTEHKDYKNEFSVKDFLIGFQDYSYFCVRHIESDEKILFFKLNNLHKFSIDNDTKMIVLNDMVAIKYEN